MMCATLFQLRQFLFPLYLFAARLSIPQKTTRYSAEKRVFVKKKRDLFTLAVLFSVREPASPFLFYSSSPFSMAVISSTRRWCLPPSNSAVSQWVAIILARSTPTTRAPMVRILLLL